MKNLEINEKVRMEVITIEELLDNIDTGKICLPEYQRPVVWTDEQVKLLADTVKNGYPYGVLSLAEITSDDGDTKALLIDGHQRRSALAKIVSWYDEKLTALFWQAMRPQKLASHKKNWTKLPAKSKRPKPKRWNFFPARSYSKWQNFPFLKRLKCLSA